MDKGGRLELGDNIYGYYKSIFNHCDVFGGDVPWLPATNTTLCKNYGRGGERSEWIKQVTKIYYVKPAPDAGGVVDVLGASAVGGGRDGAPVPVERSDGADGVVADCGAVGPPRGAATVTITISYQ